MWRLLAVAIAALAVMAGCSSDEQDRATTSTSQQQLHFRVVGQCTPREGVLTSVSSGFTPNGEYITDVVDPSGQPYPPANISNPGRVSADGQTGNWRWDCALVVNGKRDAPGRYEVTITDVETDREITTSFTIDVS